jgi:hypothetical protein
VEGSGEETRHEQTINQSAGKCCNQDRRRFDQLISVKQSLILISQDREQEVRGGCKSSAEWRGFGQQVWDKQKTAAMIEI